MQPLETTADPQAPPPALAAEPQSARLIPMTTEAQSALGGRTAIRVAPLPFRVGRESRSPNRIKRLVDRRLGLAPSLNTLYLLEQESGVMQISREHFEITWVDDRFVIIDRGSACGTGVGGARIGGDRRGGWAMLKDGDRIVVGSSKSPYIFQFDIASQG